MSTAKRDLEAELEELLRSATQRVGTNLDHKARILGCALRTANRVLRGESPWQSCFEVGLMLVPLSETRCSWLETQQAQLVLEVVRAVGALKVPDPPRHPDHDAGFPGAWQWWAARTPGALPWIGTEGHIARARRLIAQWEEG